SVLLCRSHPPPPSSPSLFPYTTLFRSETDPGRRTSHERDLSVHPFQLAGAPPAPANPIADARVAADDGSVEDRVQNGGDPREHEDRKSTRLNSSHRTISYAVFCLKKKN